MTCTWSVFPDLWHDRETCATAFHSPPGGREPDLPVPGVLRAWFFGCGDDVPTGGKRIQCIGK